jgi:hypothetical protein
LLPAENDILVFWIKHAPGLENRVLLGTGRCEVVNS